MLKIIQLMGVWHEIFDFRVFHVSVSLGSLSIPLTKIRVDIQNFVFVACIIDTGDKLFTGSITPAIHLV
jgi:hypothetical protein